MRTVAVSGRRKELKRGFYGADSHKNKRIVEKQSKEKLMRHTNCSPLMLIVAIVTALGFCIAIPTAARADVISDWNVIAIQEAITAARPGGSPAIDFATMHAAMYDAVQAIERDYEPYRVADVPNAGGSPVA